MYVANVCACCRPGFVLFHSMTLAEGANLLLESLFNGIHPHSLFTHVGNARVVHLGAEPCSLLHSLAYPW